VPESAPIDPLEKESEVPPPPLADFEAVTNPDHEAVDPPSRAEKERLFREVVEKAREMGL